MRVRRGTSGVTRREFLGTAATATGTLAVLAAVGAAEVASAGTRKKARRKKATRKKARRKKATRKKTRRKKATRK